MTKVESQAWQDDLWAAVSASLPDDERIAATVRLGRVLDRQAFEGLCAIAGRPGQSDGLYRAAGESAARVAVGIGAIDEASLHDFFRPAYLGFDAVIAAHLRGDALT
jgi:hypothetical protein